MGEYQGLDELCHQGHMNRLLDSQRYAYSELRAEVLKRDKYRCRYCNVKVTDETANIDHAKPWQNGGKTKPVNLVTCCRDCNKAKGNESWQPHGTKKHFVAPRQRQRRREIQEERAWARRNGPIVIVIEPGGSPGADVAITSGASK